MIGARTARLFPSGRLPGADYDVIEKLGSLALKPPVYILPVPYAYNQQLLRLAVKRSHGWRRWLPLSTLPNISLICIFLLGMVKNSGLMILFHLKKDVNILLPNITQK